MKSVANRIAIRAVTDADLPAIDAIDFGTDLELDWRYGGKVPAPNDRRARLWGPRVLFQQAIVTLPEQRCIGYGTLYDYDLRSQHAWVATAVETRRGANWAVLGVGLFIAAAFQEWPLRFVYAETNAANFEQFSSVVSSGVATVVGTFPDRQRLPNGQTADVFWLQISRDAWEGSSVAQYFISP